MKKLINIVLSMLVLFLLLVIGLNTYINNFYKDDPNRKATMSYEELTSLSKNVKDDRVNILMIGVDSLTADDNFANMRTDTMMVLSMDPKSKTAFVLSIPRDTRVEVDKYKGKINSAYSIGGVNFTLKSVKELLDIPIHHFVEIDYQALFKTINDVGGVDINVPMDMVYDDPWANPPLHINLKKGLQLLDGEKSMQFLRFRHGYAEQDLDRIKAQQEFLNALIKKILSVESITRVPNYIDTFYKYVKTDMSLAQMFQIASKAIEIKPHNIQRETLAGEAKFMYGASYYIKDEEKSKIQLDRLLQGKYYKENETTSIPTESNTKSENTTNNNTTTTESSQNKSKAKENKPIKNNYIVVLNGVGKQGLAQRAKDLLYVNNLDVQDTSNADNFDYTNTYIYYKDDISLAENVQKILGTGIIEQSNKAYYSKPTDILIVLGKDFTK